MLEGLGCHPLVLEGCRQRNYVPTVHGYDDHVFVTTQSPSSATPGTSTCSSSTRSSATTTSSPCTGRSTPTSTSAHALVETAGVLAPDRRRPVPPEDARPSCRYAITSAVARRQSGLIREVAAKLPGLEKHVMSSQLRDPEALLETMFLIRHELITDPHHGRPVPRHLGADGRDRPARRRRGLAPTPATSPTSSNACGRSPTASRTSCSA